MSRSLELTIPNDIQPLVEEMLVTNALRMSTLCDQFVAIQEERSALLLSEGNPALLSAVTSNDIIIGADKIAELPLDRAERQPFPPLGKEIEKLDKREQELKNTHTATVQKSAADLWEMQPALGKHTLDFIGMAAVLETVTPYEGDRQTVMTRVGSVFTSMRWRIAALQEGMPVLGFDAIGTDQLTTFGGTVGELAASRGSHASVLLDLTLKSGREIFRALPPLLNQKDLNYLYYAGKEQGEFADNAYANSLTVADVDRAIREARPQRF